MSLSPHTPPPQCVTVRLGDDRIVEQNIYPGETHCKYGALPGHLKDYNNTELLFIMYSTFILGKSTVLKQFLKSLYYSLKLALPPLPELLQWPPGRYFCSPGNFYWTTSGTRWEERTCCCSCSYFYSCYYEEISCYCSCSYFYSCCFLFWSELGYVEFQ